ncbi:hypothetical protein HOP50_01g07860 [Chloropicon primus]|uniref:MYND-type domain-containing protein n=1 Tax=Chloropicon primus TaxID=1764295 RepID=A0A5B8MDG2_9CHLO|nr:hypothetical protein A3770_01p07990 [Chloropicon primus]UPQ97492.1 hypothetical protein HOP50_01g07860 [Chloropicon primus]|eukprot:QDZ18281.1 hypothetical protein A3770_01p07990 [Chloropicon primus]
MVRRKQSCSYPGCTEEWSFYRCSRCKSAFYCCREHQALHWKDEGENGHRAKCEEIANAKANSRGARERRCLLVDGFGGTEREGKAEDLSKGSHVHAKGGLRSALQRQRNVIAELNARIFQVEEALGARERGGACTGAYRRTEVDGRALEDLDASGLLALKLETTRLRDLAAEACQEMERDLSSVRDWERFESGFETRDVLANGERRLHMELRYGREVTVDDVESELQSLSKDQRKLRLIEGIGKDTRDGRLPGPVVMDNIASLLKIEK